MQSLNKARVLRLAPTATYIEIVFHLAALLNIQLQANGQQDQDIYIEVILALLPEIPGAIVVEVSKPKKIK